MNFTQYHNRVIRQRDVTQELYRQRELARRMLEVLNRLPDNPDTISARFRFLTLDARLNESIRHAERMDHRLSLIGSVARYDSNGNNTNSPNGRNNSGPSNSGNNTGSGSSNTNNRDVNTSSNSNTRNIITNNSIIIMFTLFVFISITLFQFTPFEVTQVNCPNLWTLLPWDFASLSSLKI